MPDRADVQRHRNRTTLLGLCAVLLHVSCSKKPDKPKRDPMPPGADASGAELGDALVKLATGKLPPQDALLTPALGLPPVGADAKGLHVVYDAATEPRQQALRTLLTTGRVVEPLLEAFASALEPVPVVEVRFKPCGTAGYAHTDGRVIVCYEAVEYLLERFKEHGLPPQDVGRAVVANTRALVGHLVADVLFASTGLFAVTKEADPAWRALIAGTGPTGLGLVLAATYWENVRNKYVARPMKSDIGHHIEYDETLCLAYYLDKATYEPFLKQSGEYVDAYRCDKEGPKHAEDLASAYARIAPAVRTRLQLKEPPPPDPKLADQVLCLDVVATAQRLRAEAGRPPSGDQWAVFIEDCKRLKLPRSVMECAKNAKTYDEFKTCGLTIGPRD